MIDPSLSLQTLIGDALAADPAITAHVDPVNIRAGMIRPENLPAIVIAPARVTVLGRASGAQIVAEVRMFLHLWTPEDFSGVAQSVAGAMLAALLDAPAASGFSVDDWERPQLVWSRDPDPARSFAKGTVALRAVLRWRVD
ncbi:tail completion protein gp17 [Roseinatronobacter sp.]|uniref:tail completion protein gp17 n=1 Tax=Roseinatronobacter sp. TaxID=1945755 RepID=UPI003F72011D